MILKVCKELYSYDNLIEAAQAYADIVDIRIEDKDFFWILYFTNFQYGAKRTVKEFENYLIGLENR